MHHLLPISKYLCFPSQVNASRRSRRTQHAPVERVLYIFGCTHEGCGQLEGSWRAFSHQDLHPATDFSVCQAPADPPPNDGSLDDAVSGSQQLDWSATDTAQSWGPSSPSLQPTSMPNSSGYWELDHTGWVDESSAAAAADTGASTSLEQLSMALEGLTTKSSTATKVVLQATCIQRPPLTLLFERQGCMQTNFLAPHPWPYLVPGIWGEEGGSKERESSGIESS